MAKRKKIKRDKPEVIPFSLEDYGLTDLVSEPVNPPRPNYHALSLPLDERLDEIREAYREWCEEASKALSLSASVSVPVKADWEHLVNFSLSHALWQQMHDLHAAFFTIAFSLRAMLACLTE